MIPRRQTNQPKVVANSQPAELTFMDHVHELRSRLFWIALVFVIGTAVAYPFFDYLIDFLTMPLGDEELFYLTPGGGLSFIVKVCMYVGALVAVPAFIYHLYRYIQPVIGYVRGRTVLGYLLFSVILAAAGISFAYTISLPAALHFLTNFDIGQITAMLTADSYFSFVITYVVGAALLFQLPLVLLIINSVTPLTPGGLMRYQKHVILSSFILGAIISPTADALNQALLAGPIIVMYQLGIVIVWLRNLSRRGKVKKAKPVAAVKTRPVDAVTEPKKPAYQLSLPPTEAFAVKASSNNSKSVLINDFSGHKPAEKLVAKPVSRRLHVPERPQALRPVRPVNNSGIIRGLDGFAINM